MTAFEVKYRPIIVYADTFADLAAIPADLTLTKHAFILDSGDEYVLEPKSTVWQKLTDAEAAAIAELEAELNANRIYNTASSAAVCSFSDGADGVPMKSIIAEIAPVQDLHGQEYPYPAGGGKNLFNNGTIITPAYIDASGNVITTLANGWGVSDYIPVTEGDYIASGYANTGSGVYLGVYDANKEFVRSILMPTGATKTTSVTIATGEAYVRMSVRIADGEQNTAQFEKGSTATAYAPYSNMCPISGWDGVTVTHTDGNDYSQTYSITFPTPPGTVYGGTLDLISGELTVDRAIVTVDGTNTRVSGVNITQGLYYGIINVPEEGYASDNTHKTTSNMLVDVRSIATGLGYMYNSTSYMFILPDQSLTNASMMDAWFAEHPLQFVYELATPVVYQLDPVTVTTLLKQNTIFADTGNTAVVYCADPKTYIDNAIATAVAALS